MPEEGSPCDLGGRAQKLGEKTGEKRRMSVLESPPPALSVAVRRQQQITVTIQWRLRHLAGINFENAKSLSKY